jgi:hypothetical protein
MQIGVILSKLCTLLIFLAQNFEQLLIRRLITGIGWALRSRRRFRSLQS